MSKIIDVFDQVADDYDAPSNRFFPFAADYLTTKMQLHGRQKILDVATGTGVIAVSAAQMVRTGRVIAIDLSSGMLAKAQATADKMALENIDFFEMDGQQLTFKSAYFDHVLCGFGLFFFADMPAGLKAWLRVLKPGGHVGFTSFATTSFHPMVTLFFNQLEAFGTQADQVTMQALDEPDKCEALLTQAGFTEVSIEPVSLGYHLSHADQWWDVIWGTALRGLLSTLTVDQLVTFKAQHLAEVAALVTDKGLWMPVDVLFCVGCKAEKTC